MSKFKFKNELGIKQEQKEKNGAIDGAWTRDNRNHNPGLYQLSYNRHYIHLVWCGAHNT